MAGRTTPSPIGNMSGMITQSTTYGPLRLPDWGDDLVVRALRTHGEWSLAEQILVAPMIQSKDSLWDVGGFLGTFGIGVAQLAVTPPARIVTFEPNPELLPFLNANLGRNAPCAHRTAAVAVAGTAGNLRRRADSEKCNSGAIAYEPGGEQDDCVAARSLEDLRGEFGDYDVLKLDIEGMENEVIRGDIEYIMEHRPVIWAECTESANSILMLEALCWLKYEPLYVAFPAFRKQNFKRSGEIFFPMAYEAALLAAPAGRLRSFTGQVPGEEIIVRPVLTSYDLRRALWATPRWSMPEWVDLTKTELVALLGRQYRGEQLENFLNPII
jgi:FkbM family methyltransferase